MWRYAMGNLANAWIQPPTSSNIYTSYIGSGCFFLRPGKKKLSMFPLKKSGETSETCRPVDGPWRGGHWHCGSTWDSSYAMGLCHTPCVPFNGPSASLQQFQYRFSGVGGESRWMWWTISMNLLQWRRINYIQLLGSVQLWVWKSFKKNMGAESSPMMHQILQIIMKRPQLESTARRLYLSTPPLWLYPVATDSRCCWPRLRILTFLSASILKPEILNFRISYLDLSCSASTVTWELYDMFEDLMVCTQNHHFFLGK